MDWQSKEAYPNQMVPYHTEAITKTITADHQNSKKAVSGNTSFRLIHSLNQTKARSIGINQNNVSDSIHVPNINE